MLRDDAGKAMRGVPEDWTNPSSPIAFVSADAPWKALGEMFDVVKPKYVGLLMPFVSQLHRYAYREARARGIVTSLVPPSNVAALTGLMEDIPIEAIVADEVSAHHFAVDLEKMGGPSLVHAWFIVSPKDVTSTFVPPSGLVFRGTFL